jgi:hypothetical protein
MTESPLVCANHPTRETMLRCNKCEKAICGQCAIQTPVGYRCKECVRGQQAIFDTARSIDYFVAGVITTIGVAISVALLRFVGFWGLLLAPAVGGGLAELVRRAVGRRRSRRLPLAVILGGVLGVLPSLWPLFLTLLLSITGNVNAGFLGGGLLSGLLPLGYGFLIVSTLIARIGGIRL